MEKRKEKADLEQLLSKLLNDLLRIGWKPFNRDKTLHIDCYNKCKGMNYKWIYLDGGFMNEESRTLRELVSIDSGLWQFVCENGMVENKYKDRRYYNENKQLKKACFDDDYEYRIIESSLKNEDELEQFLLDNIKVGNEN